MISRANWPTRRSEDKRAMEIIVLKGAGHAADLGPTRPDRSSHLPPVCCRESDLFDDLTGLRQRQAEIGRGGFQQIERDIRPYVATAASAPSTAPSSAAKNLAE